MTASSRTYLSLLVVACTLLTGGCGSMATRRSFYRPIAEQVRKGNYAAASLALDKARDDGKFDEKDRFLYFMDAGLLAHYSDSLDKSTSQLSLAEKTSEELFTKSVSRAALSMLLNDNALEYAGEDYEVLYSNVFKALNFISVDSFDAAFVEIRRANQKLELLNQKYATAAEEYQKGNDQDSNHIPLTYKAVDVRFNNDAFVRYLSMQMYAAAGKYDDARIDSTAFVQAFTDQPNLYPFRQPEVRFAVTDSSKALLSVVGLTGLAPVKEAKNFRIRTDKQLDVLSILYTEPTGEETVFENIPMKLNTDLYFKFSVPSIVQPLSVVTTVRVIVDGKALGELALLEDVGIIARESFQAHKSLIYLKSIARAVVKGIAANRAKSKADTGGFGGWLKKAAIDVASDLTENADLRCVQYLPGQIRVADFAVTPGVHDIVFQFLGSDGQVVSEKIIPKYKVLKRGLNLLAAECLN
ncbi:MAG: hypothetical protein WAU88_01735 [Candidatus Zixiibacteriota bacterium]